MTAFLLIALDVDGTLITDDHLITDQTKATIKTVHDKGARIVLCTGRGPVSTLPILQELGLSGTAITHNGAATISSDDRTVLHQYSFYMEEVEQVISYCRKNSIHYDVNTAFDMYVDRMTDEVNQMYIKHLADYSKVDDVMMLTEPMVKVSIFADAAVLDQLAQDWSVIGNSNLSMIRSGETFIDVLHPEANKGNALRRLTDLFGMKSQQVLAIGNYYNDIEMIEFAGLGIAMENSPEAVKSKADAVTASNNEDGVSQAIIRYCM